MYICIYIYISLHIYIYIYINKRSGPPCPVAPLAPGPPPVPLPSLAILLSILLLRKVSKKGPSPVDLPRTPPPSPSLLKSCTFLHYVPQDPPLAPPGPRLEHRPQNLKKGEVMGNTFHKHYKPPTDGPTGHMTIDHKAGWGNRLNPLQTLQTLSKP